MLHMDIKQAMSDPMSAFSMVHEDEFDNFVELNQSALINNTPFDWTGRMQVENATKWINISSIPELQENGDTLWHGIMVDITDSK